MITTPELDNFTRANEAPLSGGGNWFSTAVGGIGFFYQPGFNPNNLNRLGIDDAFRLDNNRAKVWNGFSAGSAWATAFADGDHQIWAETADFTDVNQNTNESIGLFLCLQSPTSSSFSGYLARYRRTSIGQRWQLLKIASGVVTILNTSGTGHDAFGFAESVGIFDPDKVMFQRVGDVLEFWWYDDDAATWTQKIGHTDTTWMGGYGGIYADRLDTMFGKFGGGVPIEFVPQVMRYQ